MSRIRSIHPDLWPIKIRGSFRHLYVVQEGDDGPVKVGIAANAFWRLSELQVGNHRPLKLCAVFEGEDKRDVYAFEQHIHSALSPFAIGGEWFACSPQNAIDLITQEVR